MNYQIITNIQEGNPCQLQHYIDNRDGTKKVALKYIKYSKVFYDLLHFTAKLYKPGFIIINSLRFPIREGVYSFQEIENLFKNNGITIKMTENRIVIINLPKDTYLLITYELAIILGFKPQDKYFYQQQKSKIDQVLRAKKTSKFGMPQNIYICLDQLKTDENCINGVPSTILEVFPVPDDNGSIVFVRFMPFFKKLASGIITELTVCLKDEKNNFIKNNGQNITAELCIK